MPVLSRTTTYIHTKWHFFFNCWLLCFCNDVERHFPCLSTLSASLVGGCVEKLARSLAHKGQNTRLFRLRCFFNYCSTELCRFAAGRWSLFSASPYHRLFPPFRQAQAHARDVAVCLSLERVFFCVPLLPTVAAYLMQSML